MLRKRMTGILIGLMALSIFGMAPSAQTNSAAKPAPAPAMQPASAGSTVVVFETAKGAVEITLLTSAAPKSTAHIIDLVRKHFYRGQRVHRVINSLAQFGDPQSKNVTMQSYWGSQGSGTPIGAAEISKTEKHVRGAVGIGYAGDDPKQADSQIYIMKTSSPSLDGRYAIIGRVTAGLAHVDGWQVGEVITNCYVKGEKK